MLGEKYKFYQLPVLSFFSQKMYREVGRSWTGGNFAYIFILLSLCCIPAALDLNQQMLKTLGPNQHHVLNQVPDIHIKHGHVLIDQIHPIFIRREDGTPVAIIDTTGSMNFIYHQNVNILLTESKLVIRRGKNLFNTFDLSRISDFHINKELLGIWLDSTREALGPIIYGCFLMISFILTIVVMLLTAVLGMFISSAVHSSLRFIALLRIAAAAATPSIILMTITTAIGINIPGMLYIAVVLGYLLVGIRACDLPHEYPAAVKLNLATLLN